MKEWAGRTKENQLALLMFCKQNEGSQCLLGLHTALRPVLLEGTGSCLLVLSSGLLLAHSVKLYFPFFPIH